MCIDCSDLRRVQYSNIDTVVPRCDSSISALIALIYSNIGCLIDAPMLQYIQH
jgi:hypothetical protein